MNNKIIFFALLTVGVMLEVVADVLFKKFSIEKKTWFMVVGLLLYSIGTVLWALSLKYEILSKAISLFVVGNLIIVVLAGVIIFKDNLSIINKIGILFGIISIILIEY